MGFFAYKLKPLVLVAIGCLAVSVAAYADGRGCSNATLKGQYAFGVTAYTPAGFPNGPPQVITGITTFDGQGNFTQRDYAGDSLRTMGQTDFSTGETGTYTVNTNCTGSAVLNLNVPGSPPGTGIIKIMFVISNGGRHIHEVVSELIPPFSTTAVPTQTSADAWKVEPEQND